MEKIVWLDNNLLFMHTQSVRNWNIAIYFAPNIVPKDNILNQNLR